MTCSYRAKFFTYMALAAACVSCGLFAGGCGPAAGGYSFDSLHYQTVSTVAVPIFKRGAGEFRREWENRMTEALIKRIELDTPYKVTNRDVADTIIEGQIDEIRQNVLSYNTDTKIPRQIEVIFTVSFTWKDLRSGKIIAERKNLKAASTRTSSTGMVAGGESVINEMAIAIVQAMEKPW